MATRRWADAAPQQRRAAMSEPHTGAEGTGAGSTDRVTSGTCACT